MKQYGGTGKKYPEEGKRPAGNVEVGFTQSTLKGDRRRYQEAVQGDVGGLATATSACRSKPAPMTPMKGKREESSKWRKPQPRPGIDQARHRGEQLDVGNRLNTDLDKIDTAIGTTQVTRNNA